MAINNNNKTIHSKWTEKQYAHDNWVWVRQNLKIIKIIKN